MLCWGTPQDDAFIHEGIVVEKEVYIEVKINICGDPTTSEGLMWCSPACNYNEADLFHGMCHLYDKTLELAKIPDPFTLYKRCTKCLEKTPA